MPSLSLSALARGRRWPSRLPSDAAFNHEVVWHCCGCHSAGCPSPLLGLAPSDALALAFPLHRCVGAPSPSPPPPPAIDPPPRPRRARHPGPGPRWESRGPLPPPQALTHAPSPGRTVLPGPRHLSERRELGTAGSRAARRLPAAAPSAAAPRLLNTRTQIVLLTPPPFCIGVRRPT